MTSLTDEQLPEARGDRHGWGMWISLVVAGLAMIVLLVLPGFLAAGFARAGSISFCVNNEVYWDDLGGPSDTTEIRTEMMILAPSAWLMKHSQLMRRFYIWQYRLARGNILYVSKHISDDFPA